MKADVAQRRAELAGDGRFLLARDHGEPAAILGWYEGEDRDISLLATRLPFRNRGIARHLLCHVLADTYARGLRSAVMSCNPADTPIQFYRRLGFVDEVYWRRQYDLPEEHPKQRYETWTSVPLPSRLRFVRMIRTPISVPSSPCL